MAEVVSGYNAFLTFVISVITIITLVLGFLQWRTRQMVKSAIFREVTTLEIEEFRKQIKDICDRLQNLGNHSEAIAHLERQLSDETNRAKDEHIRMEKNQAVLQEDIKNALAEVNKLIGRLDAAVPK